MHDEELFRIEEYHRLLNALATLMNQQNLSQAQVRYKDFEVQLWTIPQSTLGEPRENAMRLQHNPKGEAFSSVERPEATKKIDTILIKAELVGTLYRAKDPGSPPFKKVGDFVQEGDPLFIIEAMKVMNMIRATHSGKVIEIPCEDGEPVEFGQVLMVLEPIA